ncbi:MAG: TlpA family protein disulfide reductase [Gammaproteobacteria bacterium]|nr:TlpA family protein disulfide reductase [Gammaproteobacteria bacterium]
MAVLSVFAAASAAAAKGELKPVRGAIAAGDFIAQDMQGKPVRFSEQRRNKVLLLNFWATWCPPCRKEMPAMEQLYRAYKDRGLIVLAVSQDQAALATVRDFAEQLKLTFPVWHDRDGLVGRQYSVPGVPTSYLVGRDGRIAWRVLGEYDWFSPEARAVVEQLLAARER